jgi:hypothetical protein
MIITDYINKQFEKSLFIETIANKPNLLREQKETLLESHGVLDDLDLYILKFKRFLNQNRDLKGQEFVWGDNIFEDIPNCFFDELLLRFKWNDKHTTGGGMDTNMELDDNDKLKCLEIEFRLDKDAKWDDVLSNASGVLAHEITHAWEGYQRLIGGSKSLYDVHKDANYDTIYNYSDENKNIIEKNLSFICYYLFNFEVNAYIGNIYSNLLDVAYTWASPKEGLENFQKKDRIYKKYIEVGTYISVLDGFEDSPELIEDAWVSLGRDKLSYNKIMKKLHNVYDKQLNRLRRTVSKLIYDVYHKAKEGKFNDDNI